VHSLKDLPTAAAAEVALAAVAPRADPRDALVARDGATLGELPRGARIGTGSPRRAAQLRALGYGLEIVAIRGNVDTRIGKVAAGELDGVVVAMAGLDRLGRRDVVTEALDPVQVLPAPGQGALAVECRAEDTDFAAALSTVLNDPATRAAVAAERAVLARLEAGCTAPVGALADVAIGDEGKEEIYLRAVVANIDGARAIRLSITGGLDDPEDVGNRLAANLLEAGAADLIGESR
jgi:hydroxymethylbilane synthase